MDSRTTLYTLFAAILSGVIFSSGCSTSAPVGNSSQLKTAEVPRVKSIELYLARSHMNDAEYEQFKVVDQILFQECGKLRRGRHHTRESEVVNLDPHARAELDHKVSEVLEAVQSNKREFEQPGKLSGVLDTGKYRLLINTGKGTKSVKTSLDSVSEPEWRRERRLYALASALRSFSRKNCGNPSFFGITANQ